MKVSLRKMLLQLICIGPLLSKNPEVADYIIKYCLDRKYDDNVILEPLDDSFENEARKILFNRFLNTDIK